MKRRLLQLIMLLLCLMLPFSAIAEFAFVQRDVEAYTQPDPASGVASSYKAGTWLELLEGDGVSADENYAGVVGPDGLIGYVSKTNIFVLSQSAQDAVAVVANNGKYVNLRAEGNKKAKVLAKVDTGTPVTFLENGKSYSHVRLADLDGYMATSMLKVGLQPIFSPAVKSSNKKSVNLRSEPTMNGDILASIPYGKKVSVYIMGGGWAYVRYDQTDGYIMTKFLSSSKDSPVPNPVPNPNPDSDFWDTGATRYVSNGGSSVRYRNGPGGSAKTLGKLRSGDEVYEVSTNGAWSKILINAGGNPVYMMSKYLVTIMPIEDDPVDITDPVIFEESSGDE